MIDDKVLSHICYVWGGLSDTSIMDLVKEYKELRNAVRDMLNAGGGIDHYMKLSNMVGNDNVTST